VKQLLLPIILLATAYCQAAPILPEEAKNHIGEPASVRGLVEQVSFSQKGHAFLNFGGRYPKQVFTGFIPAQNVSAVGGWAAFCGTYVYERTRRTCRIF
jgi:hypothetical protein